MPLPKKRISMPYPVPTPDGHKFDDTKPPKSALKLRTLNTEQRK